LHSPARSCGAFAIVCIASLGRAGASQDAPPVAVASRPATSNPVLLEAGGECFTAADAFEAVLFHYRDAGIEILRKLAGDAIVRAEAARLGVEVDAEDVEPMVRESVESLKKRVDTEFGGVLTFDQFLETEMFTTSGEYEQLARKFATQSRLASLTVRFDQIINERVSVRHMIVRDHKTADACIQKLRDGADFAALARAESMATTKNDGGRLPPFDRELEHPIVALAFDTPPNSVGGPIEEKRSNGTVYHIFRVIERIPARNVTFADARADVRKSLAESPITRFEFEAFMRKAGKRYPAKMLGRPVGVGDVTRDTASRPSHGK
jgi:parvulin-like peptidyl-prolyl isomerase